MNTKNEEKGKALRIAVAGRDIIGTGGGNVIINTVKEFTRLGHETVIVADYDVSSVLPGIPQYIMPGGRLLKDWEPKFKIAKVIRHFLQLVLFSIYGRAKLSKLERQGWISIDHNLEAFGGNICVLHNVFMADLLTSKNLSRRIYRSLNPVNAFRIMRERFVLSRPYVESIVGVSRRTIEEAQSFYKTTKKFYVVNNGVDIEKFSPTKRASREDFFTSLEMDPTNFYLLFVGHEFKRKGLQYIIEALSFTPNNVKLLAVGGRSENIANYKKLAEHHNVASKISFLGTRMDVADLMAHCDVFVFPSLYETFALVVLEAMSSGVPCLSTRVGGVEEYLIDGKNGFFIENDGNDIANKINRVMEEKDHTERIKINARETAMNYTWDKCADSYIELCSALTNTTKGHLRA